MPTLILRHKVRDFDTWMKGYYERQLLFAEVAESCEIFRDAEDANMVLMLVEVNDLERFQQLIEDPDLDSLKEKHTVIGPTIISEKVEV